MSDRDGEVRQAKARRAREVAALAETIKNALDGSTDDFVTEARAALAHLGIPYEEDKANA